MIPRLKTKYAEEVAPKLLEELGISNVMNIPKISKIVVNMGIGDAESKQVDAAIEELRVITGQQPRVNRARKSIAGFKLREGTIVGISVTMRGIRMWEFFDRLVGVAIPRVRDFRGLSPKSFDGNGNYTFGVTEQLIFPEVDYDKVVAVRGMDITIATTTRSDDEARALLAAFGFPFRKQEAKV